MIRQVTLDEISDGKLYAENDYVKAETLSCAGCAAMCCKHMDANIVLDPRDVFDLINASKLSGADSFDDLISKGFIALNLVDGIVLPNINMANESNSCSYLDKNNRCTIHDYRPGICRMFPLGRYWESPDKFKYILQVGQCHKDGLKEVKVSDWLGINQLEDYSKFSSNWHKYLTDVRVNLASLDEKSWQVFSIYNLKCFYSTPYKAKNMTGFYREFSMRLKKARRELNLD